MQKGNLNCFYLLGQFFGAGMIFLVEKQKQGYKAVTVQCGLSLAIYQVYRAAICFLTLNIMLNSLNIRVWAHKIDESQ